MKEDVRKKRDINEEINKVISVIAFQRNNCGFVRKTSPYRRHYRDNHPTVLSRKNVSIFKVNIFNRIFSALNERHLKRKNIF